MAEYVATRFPVSTTTGYLLGNYTYTNRGTPTAKAQYSNAGSFCTSAYAVGVAARAESAEVDYASFFAFGVGQPGSTDPTELPPMDLVSLLPHRFRPLPDSAMRCAPAAPASGRSTAHCMFCDTPVRCAVPCCAVLSRCCRWPKQSRQNGAAPCV